MKGMMLIIKPGALAGETRELTAEPPLDVIKAALDGGYLEAVPGFTTLAVRDHPTRPCVAFCDEDGKSKQLPPNPTATVLWQKALQAQGHPGLIDPAGRVVDWLVGPVVVLAGDAEFMCAI
jgi:hypothetical protein